MKHFLAIVKYDYLQRTRTYTFLITLCASLVIAYTFVPAPDAGYSTIRISDYVGAYNSAWFGYVTAILTSVFLALIGFYLVTGTIKTDNETRVGQIISATPIRNFSYLLAKAMSNFLLLLTLVGIIFLMSVALFFVYADGFPFELMKFIKPYVVITIPTLFFISVLAIVFEIVFGKYTVIQNIAFFFIFSTMMVYSPKAELYNYLDVFGTKIVTKHMEQTVRAIENIDDSEELTLGYIIGGTEETKTFQFNGIDFPLPFIASRFAWVLLSLVLLLLMAPLFHRFRVRERIRVKKTKIVLEGQPILKDIMVSDLALMTTNYTIWPLLKAEFLMLVRKGKNWLWLFNIAGMVLLAVLPLDIAHQLVLPVLWFFQVHRFSDITTKETTNRMHYYAFSSYLPLQRLLMSQLFSAFILMLGLAMPLVIRYMLLMNVQVIMSILFGGLFIVLLAAVLGLVTKGKKLFEILFFLLTYANLNKIPVLDYFGGLVQSDMYWITLRFIVLALLGGTFLIRKWQLKNE